MTKASQRSRAPVKKYWKNTSKSHQSGRRRGRRREEMQAISEGSGVKKKKEKERERELVQSRSGKRLTKLV